MAPICTQIHGSLSDPCESAPIPFPVGDLTLSNTQFLDRILTASALVAQTSRIHDRCQQTDRRNYTDRRTSRPTILELGRQGRRQVKKCGVDTHGELVEHKPKWAGLKQLFRDRTRAVRRSGAKHISKFQDGHFEFNVYSTEVKGESSSKPRTTPNPLLPSKNSSDLRQSHERR